MQRSRKINAPLILNPDFPTDSLAHSSFVFYRKASRAEWNTLTSHRTGRRSPCGLVHCCRGPEAASRAARQLCVAGAWGGGGRSAVSLNAEEKGTAPCGFLGRKRQSTYWSKEIPQLGCAVHLWVCQNPRNPAQTPQISPKIQTKLCRATGTAAAFLPPPPPDTSPIADSSTAADQTEDLSAFLLIGNFSANVMCYIYLKS